MSGKFAQQDLNCASTGVLLEVDSSCSIEWKFRLRGGIVEKLSMFIYFIVGRGEKETMLYMGTFGMVVLSCGGGTNRDTDSTWIKEEGEQKGEEETEAIRKRRHRCVLISPI